MKIVVVYLTGAPPHQARITVFPALLTEEAEARSDECVARLYPGRFHELREENVEAADGFHGPMMHSQAHGR